MESVVADAVDESERETIVKTRVNQELFRSAVLSSYDDACCITGIDLPPLLVASHIVPWSKDPRERLNPRNGLCLNALHDRAFDRGLISVDPELYRSGFPQNPRRECPFKRNKVHRQI